MGSNLFKSEEEFIKKVEKCLLKNNCKVWKEVIADNCIKSYRVDLIFHHKDFGFIGVEAKNTRSFRQGGVLAKAITQISEKYIPQTYLNGNLINKWALLVPRNFKHLGQSQDETIHREILCFIKHFLKTKYKILLMEYFPEEKWREEQIIIDSLSKQKIRIGGKSKWN